MKIGNVIGNVVSTIKHPAYAASKLMIVQPLSLKFQAEGTAMVAIDTVGAGVGEMVLIVDEGKAARDVLQHPAAPVRTLIVGIIDSVTLGRTDGG